MQNHTQQSKNADFGNDDRPWAVKLRVAIEFLRPIRYIMLESCNAAQNIFSFIKEAAWKILFPWDIQVKSYALSNFGSHEDQIATLNCQKLSNM